MAPDLCRLHRLYCGRTQEKQEWLTLLREHADNRRRYFEEMKARMRQAQQPHAAVAAAGGGFAQ